MASGRKSYDVFISHSAADASLASDVADTLRANGLDAVTYTELLPGVNVSEALWDALAESRALLAVLSPAGPTPSMAIELGAAKAWNKPIFGLITDPSLTRLPSGLSGIRLYPSDRIDDVIRAINLSGKALTEEQCSLLAQLYAEIGVSVDQLALDPGHLGELVKQFNAGTGKSLSGERLLSELLRMRKQGLLARSRPSGRSKAKRGSA